MGRVIYSDEFSKVWKQVRRRDPAMARQVERKLVHIIAHPEHYKPLRNELKGLRRVHFGSYVLIYQYIGEDIVIFTLDHHDDAYR